MAPAFALIGIFALLIVVPRLLGSAAGAAVDAGIRTAGRGRSHHRRIQPTFETTLSVSNALDALQYITTVLPGTELARSGSAVMIRSSAGLTAQATYTAASQKPATVHLAPIGNYSDADLARLSAGVLAALRTCDPSTRVK